MKEYNYAKKQKTGHLSFWLVMLLCAAMIGVSCWFAYTQTSQDLEMELGSVLDREITAAKPETDLVRPAATEAPAAQATLPAAKPYVPPETRPETAAAAAALPAAKPHAETVTEAVTEPTAPPHQPSRFPVDGEIIQSFSGGELVKSPTTGVWQTHNGIDIAASLGDAVYPMDDGIVLKVEDDPLWGISVTIDHQNGIYSRYCSLNAGVTVTEGDSVTNTSPIGAVGDTADVESSQATHLHFEVMQGETYIDPAAYIQ